MKVVFSIKGDTTDSKLMEALNYLLEAGYPFTVQGVIPAKKPVGVEAPTLPKPKVIEAFDMSKVPNVKGNSHPVRARKFFHPSGKTARQIAIDYVDDMGTTTVMDLTRYMIREGYSPSTPQPIISDITTRGDVEIEGHMLGSKKRG